MNLRPYQQEAIDRLRRSLAGGKRRPILQAPTGCGKTVIASSIIQSAVGRGKRVLFLAPRKELIFQASAKLEALGIEHGIIMAGEPRNLYAMVQVASMDTLHSRAVRTERMLMPPADVVIVDEAHLSIAPTRKDLLAHYDGAVIVGLTATPARGDGRGLGEVYDDLVQSWSVAQLTEDGYLVQLRYWAPSKPDLDGLKLNKDGDYVLKGLGERMDRVHLVGDIVKNWRRIAGDRKTVVFCVNRRHSRHVRDEFLRHGYRAEHLDGETPADERKAILARVESGETQVLCNVFVCSYGLDLPSLSCAVLARPTRNITLYLQIIGRVMRPAPGKDDAIVIDHAGCVDEHGFADDYIPWSLDTETTVKERKKKLQEERREPKEITCGDCGTVFKRSRTCPQCGHEMVPEGKPIPTHQADLQEVERSKRKDNREATWEEKIAFYGQLKRYCEERGMKPGWAAHKYRARFGVWPNDGRLKDTPAIPVTDDVRRWITSQNIRYAKRRAA